MDRIIDAKGVADLEAWLETPGGEDYVRATCGLIDKVLDCQPGWRILDVGCGLGLHMDHLARRGMLMNGLEASPIAAKLAAHRLGHRAQVNVGDAHDLPYEDNQFDAALLVNTLELTSRRAQVLAEAARVSASRVCIISTNMLGPAAVVRYWNAKVQPWGKGRALSLWNQFRLVREVLGAVPMTWAGATLWPGVHIWRWPFGSLTAVSAAVTPRLHTTPLLLHVTPPQPPQRPVPFHGRSSHLRLIK